jgi:hypothetical protein
MNELITEIQVLFYCIDRLCEILLDKTIVAESTVEELVSMTLLTLFETVIVHDISITLPSVPICAQAPIAISIRAHGYNPLLLEDSQPLDCAIEERLSCVLLELFGTLDIEHYAVA